MSETAKRNPYGLCNFDDRADCSTCPVNHQLFCHFKRRHVLRFLLLILPVFFTSAVALLRQNNWRLLAAWITGLFFFLQVPENLILCSHCPYYAEGGRRTLRCHANLGLLKLWKFNPAPMNSAEKGIFLAGAVGVLGFPIPVNLAAGELAASMAGTAAIAGWFWSMRRWVCRECPNFSCPLNAVPDGTRRAYLARNPIFANAWNVHPQNPDANPTRH